MDWFWCCPIILFCFACIILLGATLENNQIEQRNLEFNTSIQELSCDQLNDKLIKSYFNQETAKIKIIVSEIEDDHCKIIVPVTLESNQ